ncbi:uncharacterized protein CBL_05593 [Carabus blaptoides fortunei]
MANFKYLLLTLVLCSVLIGGLAAKSECPLSSQMTNCSPKCTDDSQCSAGTRCCPNICNTKSCSQPNKAGGAAGGYKGSSSSATGTYCGNTKCNSYEKCEFDKRSDYAGPSCSTGDDTWNSWEEPGSFKPNSVQEHIEMYRQQTMAARHPSVEGEEPVHQDFFQDMTPRITRQTKVFIDDNEGEQSRGVTSRLSLAPQPIVPEGELGVWEDTQGWEEQTQPDWDPQLVLREKRRQERERRIWEQQQRKEKVMRPLSLGAKIS